MTSSDDPAASKSGSRSSVFDRLRARRGHDVDPAISLEAEPPASTEPAESELLAQLSSDRPSGARYAMKGELARGGMGAILKVWDEDLRRTLAMKVMLERKPSASTGAASPADERMLSRFLEEAQVTGQLDHPGIVPVHELGLDANGRVYFTMRLVRGRDLKTIFELVKDGKEGWSTTRALSVILKVCEAMAYAHTKGVIHRDLKPANVMVGGFGEVYVMDWGLARVVGRKDSHDLRLRPTGRSTLASVRTERRDEKAEAPDSPLFTMDGDVLGTPCYMAPEQAMGIMDELGPRSDVYSVGAMLYHLLTGSMPYVPARGEVSNRTVLAMVIQGAPKRVHALAPDVPAELAAICDKAMAREAPERYADTAAMAEDLRAYLEHRVVAAYETGALAELRKWVVRNRALAISIAAALVIALAGSITVALVQLNAKRQISSALGEALLQRQRADAKALEAERNAREAREREAEVLRLADVKRMADSTREALFLWPARPERTPDMDAWLVRARALVGNLPVHRTTLEALLTHAVEADPIGGDPDAAPAIRPVRFESTELQWQHDLLTELVGGLERLQDPDPHGGTIADVEQRLAFAHSVKATTVDAERGAWDRAIASIRDPHECPRYAGLEITPQLGLVPIGRDASTGLWEFAHIQSGEAPRRLASGDLVLTDRTGLVLVLIPAGKFSMGAQSTDQNTARYDVDARDYEEPVHEIELTPFFLSKYEVTQCQWERHTGGNPSRYSGGSVVGGVTTTPLHPVEMVSWDACSSVLHQLDLVLPTEAQWEYSARGETTSIWWCGADKRAIEGAGNVCDSSLTKPGGPQSGMDHESWNDGYMVHAPVGSFAPNGFGLHDVIGNVSEWARERFANYDKPTRPGDAERSRPRSDRRVHRGGSFFYTAPFARSTCREQVDSFQASMTIGVRPARVLEP